MSYFSFQPVLHHWCNKGCGICYPICGIMPIKEPLLLIGKSSPCCGSGFPLSLSEWSFTICPTSYNRKQNVLSASLNKTFLSFYLSILPTYAQHQKYLQNTPTVSLQNSKLIYLYLISFVHLTEGKCTVKGRFAGVILEDGGTS